MPRPKWTPTDEQQLLIDNAVRLHERHRDAQDEYEKALTKAAEGGVVISALAAALKLTRKTVYRHLGRPMK